MNRTKLFTITAAIGIFVGTLGLGAVTTQALASAIPGHGNPATGPAQAAPTATPTATLTGVCPFRDAEGNVDLAAMEAWMDSIHGEGWFEQMVARMAASGVTPGTGYGPGTGICPLGLGTGPGTGLAPQDGTGFQYGPGAGWRGGMMGAGFGFGANR